MEKSKPIFFEFVTSRQDGTRWVSELISTIGRVCMHIWKTIHLSIKKSLDIIIEDQDPTIIERRPNASKHKNLVKNWATKNLQQVGRLLYYWKIFKIDAYQLLELEAGHWHIHGTPSIHATIINRKSKHVLTLLVLEFFKFFLRLHKES